MNIFFVIAGVLFGHFCSYAFRSYKEWKKSRIPFYSYSVRKAFLTFKQESDSFVKHQRGSFHV